MKRLVVLVLVLGGCLFDRGSSSLSSGTVQRGLLCDPAPPPDGCPPCSTAEGARCRDQWYATALRCSSDAQCGAPGACQRGLCVLRDDDGDGLDDDVEREVAELNFPRLLLADDEGCGAPHGVLYRARRHPLDATRIAITYVVLYANDCGELTGHVGDAESFAITVDLDAQPGAAATVGVQAWAHAGTACGSTSSCAAAAGTGGCASPPGASGDVTIWASADKHANYLSTSTCADNCLDECSAGTRLVGPLLNVGEPDHPLVRDLTAQGFVQRADGWADELLHFDPWGSAQFSGGGRVDKPLTELAAPPGE